MTEFSSYSAPFPNTCTHLFFHNKTLTGSKHAENNKKKKKTAPSLAMDGQRVPQWEQEEVPHGTDGKEAFGVTQTRVQSQLHHCSKENPDTLEVL